jgi:hypothetical protein
MNHSFKKIFIVNCFPSSDYHLQILKECIVKLKGLDYKLMVVSHLPLPLDVQKEIDYFIYDSENPLLGSHSFSWFANSFIKATLWNIGHMLAICKNMDTSISTAQRMGYEYFYFLECDNLISEKDLSTFDNFLQEMIHAEKKMIFHRYQFNEGYYYHTLLFGGNAEYFVQKIKLPTNYDAYHAFNITGILERDFYEHLGVNESDFLIKECYEDGAMEGFRTSEMNRISAIGIVCEVLPSQTGYYLFLMNNTSREIIYYVGENQIVLTFGGYWYCPASEKMEVRIVDGKYSLEKRFELTEENEKFYSAKGFLELYEFADLNGGYGSIY